MRSSKKGGARRCSSFCNPPALNPSSSVPRDLVPELEALSQQLQAVDDPSSWLTGLTRLATLLAQVNLSEDETPSPFEIQQSGLLEALQGFLTHPSERRLRFFLLLRVGVFSFTWVGGGLKITS